VGDAQKPQRLLVHRARAAALLAVVASASIACGKFLGLDEEEPSAAPDASDEASSSIDAAGSVDVDAGRVCEKLTEDFESFTTNDELPAKGWRRFFGSPDCGILGFEGGTFVTEIPSDPNNDAAACASNAGLFRWFEGGVRDIECSFDVSATTFAGESTFFMYRVLGTDYVYEVGGGVRLDQLEVRGTARKDGGPIIDEFQRDPIGPEAGVPFRVRVRLELGGQPTFSFRWRDDSFPPIENTLPDPGTPPLVQLYVGAMFTNRPRRVAIDNVSCSACR